MRIPLVLAVAGLVLLPGVTTPATLQAQVAPVLLPSWQGALPAAPLAPAARMASRAALTPPLESSATRTHTGTGLLIGGVVGAAATGLFLAAFCSDPDTSCGADEVGRAAFIIALPLAVAGAIIGSLVQTEE